MTTTSEVIQSLLTENTGKHFLDSGGAYGRHWEQNKGRDFDKEPASIIKADGDYISVVHNLYHWLEDRLNYNEDLDDLFGEFVESKEDDGSGWMGLVDEFVKARHTERYEVGEEENEAPTGIDGEGEPLWDNSYNSENLLSQTIQFYYWTDSDGPHVLLQVHGGCDVRGGYTKPRAFDVGDDEGYAIFSYAQAGTACDNDDCEDSWFSDDANNWYFNGGTNGLNLKDLEVQVLEQAVFRTAYHCGCGRHWEEEKPAPQSDQSVLCDCGKPVFPEGETVRVVPTGDGVLYAEEENGKLYCPGCGIGRLDAWFC